MAILDKLRKVMNLGPVTMLVYAGQYYRFQRTHYLLKLFGVRKGVRLGSNVRVQSLRCIHTQRPGASIDIGDNCIIYEMARLQAHGEGTISVGPDSIIGDARIFARDSIKIGCRCLTSWNVFIQDFDPHPLEPSERARQVQTMVHSFLPRYVKNAPPRENAWPFPSSGIVIGDDVWLGANVTVLKGAVIGDGSVVATGAVVTAGDYPARSLLAGVPARVVKAI